MPEQKERLTGWFAVGWKSRRKMKHRILAEPVVSHPELTREQILENARRAGLRGPDDAPDKAPWED